MAIWKSWKYKNLTVFFFSIVFTFILSRVDAFQSFMLHLGSLGYIGAFVGGMLFVSTFTVVTGGLILFFLARSLSPVEIGLIAGLGAVFGDITIFRFVKNNLTHELEDIYNHVDGKHHLIKILHSKYFSWTLPVLGAIIIASPFPDELGVTLMGISKMKTYQFLITSFILNAVGIFLVVSASYFISS